MNRASAKAEKLTRPHLVEILAPVAGGGRRRIGTCGRGRRRARIRRRVSRDHVRHHLLADLDSLLDERKIDRPASAFPRELLDPFLRLVPHEAGRHAQNALRGVGRPQELFTLDRDDFAGQTLATADKLRLLGWLLPVLALAAFVVAAAGGIDVAGLAGERSYRLQWSDVARLAPDVVVLAPCGFDLDRTLGEIAPLELAGNLLGTPARDESRVFAVDADAMFSRPGPRVVDGVELLAYLLHPEAYGDPGFPWSRVRVA